jgi:hypothetical protein
MMRRVAIGGRLASWRASALASASLRPADEPGHALAAAEAGRDPEVRLRLPHPRRFLEDPEVTGHGDLTAAADGVAVDGGDDRLRKALDLPHDGVAEAHEGLDVAPGERRAEVGAGAEDLVTRPRDDHRAHVVVGLHRGERLVEIAHELLADGVARRPVQGDGRELLFPGNQQGFIPHRG